MRIYLRDPNFNVLGEIKNWDNLTMVDNDNDLSTWQISIPSTERFSNLFNFDSGPMGLIFERDGTTELSGPFVGISEQYKDGKTTYVIQGHDDIEWLDNRRAYPATFPFTSGTGYDSKNDLGSTAIIYYVNRNLVAGTYGAWRNVTGLSLAADPLVGSTIKVQARFQNLLYWCQLLALQAGDIGFKCMQTPDDSGPIFTVFDRSDVSDRVVFSVGSRNLSEYQYDQNVPDANVTAVGGGGLLTSRTFNGYQDSGSIAKYGRREDFLDRRDTTDSTTLFTAAVGEITAKAAKESLGATIINTGTLQYRRDYAVGDIVQVELNSGTVITDVIRQVTFNYQSGQPEKITPVVGSPGASDPRVKSSTSRLADLESKVLSLEAQ